jgi:pyruvate/2-oxoglutarate dehydrogenase complex dihydrolipoamide acyltransferase (E2) component
VKPIDGTHDSGSIALRPMLYVAPNSETSYDHRIVDGAEARGLGFLVHIKNAIENSERMLLVASNRTFDGTN